MNNTRLDDKLNGLLVAACIAVTIFAAFDPSRLDQGTGDAQIVATVPAPAVVVASR